MKLPTVNGRQKSASLRPSNDSEPLLVRASYNGGHNFEFERTFGIICSLMPNYKLKSYEWRGLYTPTSLSIFGKA